MSLAACAQQATTNLVEFFLGRAAQAACAKYMLGYEGKPTLLADLSDGRLSETVGGVQGGQRIHTRTRSCPISLPVSVKVTGEGLRERQNGRIRKRDLHQVIGWVPSRSAIFLIVFGEHPCRGKFARLFLDPENSTATDTCMPVR